MNHNYLVYMWFWLYFFKKMSNTEEFYKFSLAIAVWREDLKVLLISLNVLYRIFGVNCNTLSHSFVPE